MFLRTSFTCNSLKSKHILAFMWIGLFAINKKKFTNRFINQISNYFNISKDRIFLFGSARMGLYLILKSLNSRKDDEVIVAGYTCVVVTNAIKYSGMRAKYVDIDEQNLNIDTNKILKEINNKTKAIITTHNFGVVYEDIKLIKEKYPDIIIIEDAAHTFGSVSDSGIKVGLLGDASFFSLEYSKPLTTGMGGIIIINNNSLIENFSKKYKGLNKYPKPENIRISLTLISHFFTSFRNTIFLKHVFIRILKKLNLLFQSSQQELKGEFPEHYPVKLSPILSYLGYLQIKDINNINKIKQRIGEKYFDVLNDVPNTIQYFNKNFIYVRYPIVFEENVSLAKIESIKDQLHKIGVSYGIWFNDVVHPKGSYRYCYLDGACGIGESISKRILNLPIGIHARIKDSTLQKIKDILIKNLVIY